MTSNRDSKSSALERLLYWSVLAPTCVLPLTISPRAADAFRLPKELLLRGQGIVIASLVLAILIVKPAVITRLFHDRVPAATIMLFASIPLLATLTSTNRSLSITSLAYAGSCFVLYLGTCVIAELISVRAAVWAGVAAAVPNAALAISQRLHWWNPFEFASGIEGRMRITALVGNPNDVGGYLAVCAIVMIGFALVSRKPIAFAMAALLVSGVVAADSVTALIALLAGVTATTLMISRRPLAAAAVVLIIVVVAMIPNRERLVERYDDIRVALQTDNLQALSSNRVVAFLVACDVFRDHPLLGAGPGTFRWHYLPYRLGIEQRHPRFYMTSIENFGEVHNDHLQILAEEGLVGYVAFLCAALLIAARSFSAEVRSRNERHERLALVRVVAFPLVITFLVLALASFPLELAAIVTRAIFFSALILRWSSTRETA